MTEAKQTAMFLCRRSTARCRYCDRASTRLCDFEVAVGKTCDIPMCDFCTHRADQTVDYCPEHRGTGDHRPRKCRIASELSEQNNDVVKNICQRYANDEPVKQIAKSFGVSKQIIYNVVKGRRWNSGQEESADKNA
jgi:hypothetical protein